MQTQNEIRKETPLVVSLALGLSLLATGFVSPFASAEPSQMESSGLITTLLLGESPPRFVGSPLGVASSLAVYDAPLASAIGLVDPSGRTVATATVRMTTNPLLPDHYFLFWHAAPNAPGLWSLAYAGNGSRIASVIVTQQDLAPPMGGLSASVPIDSPSVTPPSPPNASIPWYVVPNATIPWNLLPNATVNGTIPGVGNVTNDTNVSVESTNTGSGPKVSMGSKTYSGKTANGAPGGAAWCATESGYCSVSYTRDVIYGMNSQYYKINGVSGGISCTNEEFGDPNVGVHKECYANYGPVGTSWCADQGYACTFDGTKDVAFGSQSTGWSYQYAVAGGTQCGGAPDDPHPHDGQQVLACYTVDGSGSGGGTGRGTGSGAGKVGPSGYNYCADEGQHCPFSGTKDVAYGYNGNYYYKYSVSGGIDCNNQQFGDPAYGHAKACFTKDQTTTGGNTGSEAGFVYCTSEGQHCYFSGTKDVSYGTNGQYYYKYGVTGGIDCTNEQFGDPAYGQGKACYTRDSSTPNPNTANTDWTYCASESETCPFSGPEDVRYGTSGQYYYAYSVTGGIGCNNEELGDPFVGVHKYCYIKDSPPTSSTCDPMYETTSGGYMVPWKKRSINPQQMPSQQEGYLVQYAQEEGGTLECGGQRVINEPASWDYSYEMYGTSDQITSAGYTYTMSTGHQANGCRGVGSTSTFCFETLDPQIGIRHGTAGTREYWYANLDPGVFKASRDHVSPNQGDDSFVDKALSDLLGFVSGRAFGWDFSSVANLFPTGPSPKYTPVDNGNEDYMQFNYDDLAAHSEGMRVNVQFYDNNHGLSYNRVHGAIQGIGTVYDFSNGHAYPVVQLTHTIELETTVTINHT